MATCACTPESMAEMRCASGCSTLVTMPGMSASASRMSSRISSRLRGEFGSNVATISDWLTGTACSSNSARPVLRTKATISSIRCSRCFDFGGDPTGRGQRSPRRQNHVDLHRTFVERRQKVAFQPQQATAADRHGRQRHAQDQQRDPQS